METNPMRTGVLLALLGLALIAASAPLASGTGGTGLSQTAHNQAQKKSEDDDEDEGDRILERIRLYLRRHGDAGKIDPERRLQALRQEHNRYVAEQSMRAEKT